MADDGCNFYDEDDFDDLENEDESNDWAEMYIGEGTQWINYSNNPSQKNAQTEENSRYENLQVKEDVYENDDKAKGLSRMELNDHKAGMMGLDKQKINQIIFEASKGSKFYENELKKEKQVAERIAKQNMSLEKLTQQQRKVAFQAIDLIVEELERKRDLSRTFVHIDMDAFYAAVEILDNPELGDKPMAVGGNSMLSTSNYPARRYGVRAAMPGFIAKKLCPELIIVPPHFEKYKEYSRQVQDILAEYDPNFAMASLDEAYLDLTEHLTERHKGQEKKRFLTSKCNIHRMVKNEMHPDLEQIEGEIVEFGTDAEEAVRELRFRIEQKTKLTASAGIAPNAMLAKICSDRNKPNGQFYLKPNRNDVMEFIRSLPIRKISGIGRVSEQMLKALGIETCEDLYRKRDLLYLLHSPISFKFLIEVSLGLGPTSLTTESKRKSIGTEETFSEISKPTELLDMCGKLCQSLAQDIKGQELKGKTVTIKLKTVNFEIKSRSSSTSYPVSTYEEISLIAKELLKHEMNTCFPEPLKLRLMGVRLSNLQDTSSNSSKEAKQNTITGFLKQKQNVKSQGMLVSFPTAQQLNVGEHFGLPSLSQHYPEESDVMTGAYACQRTDQYGSCLASLSSEGVASNSVSKKSSSLSGSVSTSDSILLKEHSDDTNPSAVFCPVCELEQKFKRGQDVMTELNRHIDLCLNKATIKELASERNPRRPSTVDVEMGTSRVKRRRQQLTETSQKATLLSFWSKS
ncbi:DNA polymerase kappa-like [Stylophora pistillata]|nr:DNA polymerase kappa-like [Stylophora pistillata]